MSTTVIETDKLSLEWYEARADKVRRWAYIERLCKQIADSFHPDQIILFGSHAWGEPTADSDIDLLVMMPYQGRHTSQAIRIVNELKTLAPIDLLVRTPEEVRERLEIGDTFMRKVMERGNVMYEADHSGVDR
jgi:uncharacterized protein